MTTYNSYEAAKIAMPEACIVEDTDTRLFFGVPTREGTTLAGGSRFAEPQYYCMTVEKFLSDGNKFSDGDVVVNREGLVKRPLGDIVRLMNIPSKYDVDSFILRAAALEEKKPRTKVGWVDAHHSEAVYYFTKTDDDMYAEPDESQRYDDLQDYINNLEENGSSSLYRRIETPMTERDELLEALQSVWIIDGVDGQEQLEKIVDSGLFKLVN